MYLVEGAIALMVKGLCNCFTLIMVAAAWLSRSAGVFSAAANFSHAIWHNSITSRFLWTSDAVKNYARHFLSPWSCVSQPHISK
jgi:hypothetical protein